MSMTIKSYGEPDEDTLAADMLHEAVKDEKVKYFLYHPRTPIGARPCKLPGSLTVQAVLENGKVVTVVQHGVGKKPRLQ